MMMMMVMKVHHNVFFLFVLPFRYQYILNYVDIMLEELSEQEHTSRVCIMYYKIHSHSGLSDHHFLPNIRTTTAIMHDGSGSCAVP